MADDREAKEVIFIQGVAFQDGRGTVGITPLQEGRSPVSMTIQPNDINSGRAPISVTPLTPGQPTAPTQPPASSPDTQPATGEKK
jgi:hypothetical protein